eukprot:2528524-Pleurochrysis_carterae.AAC.1
MSLLGQRRVDMHTAVPPVSSDTARAHEVLREVNLRRPARTPWVATPISTNHSACHHMAMQLA